MGWHSDDEKELGKNPIIASLSLGAVRNFQLKHKTDSALKYALALEHGSLLIMKGSTQEFWKHQLPKTKKEISPRINLTFRTII
jgi:alkylated DNA repair dioxygenase AlkB